MKPLTDADRCVPKPRDDVCVEALRPFQRPSLICVKERLAIVANSLAVAIDDNRRVIEFGPGGPFRRRIDLLGVSGAHDTVILERNCSRP